MSESAKPITGTWDFTTDACEVLARSGQPYFILAAQEGSGWCHRQHGITTLNGVDWFREKVNAYLDQIEEGIRNRDGD